jgi:ribonuclease R
VGRLFERLGVPFLRRIHDEPDEASLAAMAKLLTAAGFAVPKRLAAADLQSLLARVKGKPEAYAVSLAVLKSMQMAEYSPAATGHFALASRCYTHFTSPIRRYPDLMVHRLLDLHLTGGLKARRRRKGSALLSDAELKDLGVRLSFAARRAESAERELKTLKILQLLAGQVGEAFEGVVTGVTNFGMFVQHPKFLIEGLLRLEDLPDDWWEVDVSTGRVRGERTRRTIAMGSKLKVQISEVDLSGRRLSVVMADGAAGKGRTRRATKRQGKPRSAAPRTPRRRKRRK